MDDDDPLNREVVDEELVVDVELPPMMADMDVDGVVVVEQDVEPEEEEEEVEVLVWLLLLMVEGAGLPAGAADDDGLDEFSSRSCWT